MPVKLNTKAYEHAMNMIEDGLEVEHDENNWEEVKATTDEEIRYLNSHGLEKYGTWFLGINTEADPQSRTKYVYPFGDFSVLHKSALRVAEKLAEKHHHQEIKAAAKKLLVMIDEQ